MTTQTPPIRPSISELLGGTPMLPPNADLNHLTLPSDPLQVTDALIISALRELQRAVINKGPAGATRKLGDLMDVIELMGGHVTLTVNLDFPAQPPVTFKIP